jgi:hypothetical protein
MTARSGYAISKPRSTTVAWNAIDVCDLYGADS